MKQTRITFSSTNGFGGALALFGESTKQCAGNLLAYITEKQPGIVRDRLLDILVLITERLATEHHLCLLAVHFEIWAGGPVQKDLYIDLSSERMIIMKDYLRKEHGLKGDIIFAKTKPDIRMFPEKKRRVIREVVAEAIGMPDSDLRRKVAGHGSFWEMEASRIGYLHAFRQGILATSDEEFDFGRMIDDRQDREAYYEDWMMEEEAVCFL